MSIIKTSNFFAIALSIALKTTAAGSISFSAGLIILAPTLFAHISNCSTAAALNVSAAAIKTFLFSLINL